MRVTGISLAIGVVLAVAGGPAQAAGEIPGFLQGYYSSLLEFDGHSMPFVAHKQENGGEIYSYVASGQSASLQVEAYPCERTVCEALLDSAFKATYQQAAQNHGKFVQISPTEFQADWQLPENQVSRFAFTMPGQILIWTLGRNAQTTAAVFDRYRTSLRNAVNRQRLELAEAGGNVQMGWFGNAFREYAESLLAEGKKQEALRVLQEIIVTSPNDLKAQLEVAQNTSDSKAARESARIVFDNAESADLAAASARILQMKGPSGETAEVLEQGLTGLQVILIPLSPCDLSLLKQAGAIYARITGIPVKIRKLKEEWGFGASDRIPNQRQTQQLIVRGRGANVNFSAWTLQQYEAELLRLSSGADPIVRYQANEILNKSGEDAAQYSVDKYLPVLGELLDKYRSADRRTIYVGVTAANISSGDSNYVFSTMMWPKDKPVSILSYHMMKAGPSGQPYESRKRLTERMAKELVPATLNALDIPRPADPSDPFSYADGIGRLDEKSLTLSKPTVDALSEFRNAP
jgi:hypothetical protein